MGPYSQVKTRLGKELGDRRTGAARRREGRAARRLSFLLLALVLLASFAFHAYYAANPTSSYQSADERAYGKLAINIAEQRHYGDATTGMRDPLHWAPGAPMLFALAHHLFPDPSSTRRYEIPAAYWLQAVISTLTALFAFGLASQLAGRWAGLLAAALVGFYPPLILATGEQLSEPLGALLLVSAFAALAAAARSWAPWANVAAGILLGLAALTRPDLLPVPFLVAALVGAWGWRTRRSVRGGLRAGVLMAVASLLALVPWSAYASRRAGEFVPVTTGGPSALFVGTYLPANGTTLGMKRALGDEAKRLNPKLRGTPNGELEAGSVLKVVAARHPDLDRNAAIALEARRNLVRYGLGDPLKFGAMMLDKGFQRLWSRYARGGARHTSPAIRAWHVTLVLASFGGLALGAVRRRSLLLAAIVTAIATSTAVHMLVVSHGRYNLPLMPAVIAGGIGGWFLLARGRGQSAAEISAPATRPPAEGAG